MPTRSDAAAPESIPPTAPAPSAAVSSTTALTETANTSFGRIQGNPIKDYRRLAPRHLEPRAKTRKEPEKREDSSREESNMEESLLDRKDGHIEVDNDYVEVSPHNINREEKERYTTGGKHKPSRDKSLSHPPTRMSSRQHPRERVAVDITTLYKEQNAKLLEAEGTILEKDRQINALTETITRLHLRDGGISRDDKYFVTEFSDITNSITAWTMTYFQKSQWQEITDLNALPIELVQTVKNVVCDSTNVLRSIKSGREVINAIVINTIYICLFGPFLFGAPDAGNSLRFVGPQLQGSDFQIQRWRALTVNLLAQGPGYERRYNEDIFSVAASLANLLAPLAPEGSDAKPRNADLHKIVGHAAALSVEIRKQSDQIYLLPIQPGVLFKSDIMEDLNCEYELYELEGKAIVQVPIFPAIMRRSCPPGGVLDEPHNLMKARVTTMFVDNE
ncbi:uncharacterized protein LAJ45_08096 [Morchella importuna]|uniref:uncharacterized protein n=1 Tax=Morchella importuna TaxID=1174673 RepID=UPI001E8E589F|nr:uncharacterized protein LAJ45_08096 [Morchella importuna]KAH8147994.1 hypothetical protein LAJ45_08096 [Morchella importuna]